MEATTLLPALVLPAVSVTVDPASLFALLADLPDLRNRRGRRYSLAAVLTLIILAKLAGETTVSGIAHWAQLRAAWLCPLLQVARPRLPCANTLTLVCATVDGAELTRRLALFFVPPLPPCPTRRCLTYLPLPAPSAILPLMGRRCAARVARGMSCSRQCICSACTM